MEREIPIHKYIEIHYIQRQISRKLKKPASSLEKF